MNIRDKILPPKRRPSINSKDKGNANERAVAKWLSAWTGKDFVRTPSSGGLRWQNSLGLNICGDVVCTNQGHTFPFTVETKHLKDISFKVSKNGTLREYSQVLTIFQQASRDADRDCKSPMMLLRCNGMPANTWWVFLEYDNAMYGVLKECPEVHPIYTSDHTLVGIISTEFSKEITYEWLCKAIH